ncbi:MAG TPA: hypothetical protein VMS01_04370 [Stellaceae bacterium]|nr:hypothetical protein [Stellaceae bacterium]
MNAEIERSVRVEVSAIGDGRVVVAICFSCGHQARICDGADELRVLAHLILRTCDTADALKAAPEALQGQVKGRA